MQRASHDRSDGQSAVSRVLPEKFRRTRRKLQRDRHRGLGNFDGSIELRGFLQVAIGALIDRTRVTTAALPREAQLDAAADHEPHSAAEPFPPWSNASSAINILPLKT